MKSPNRDQSRFPILLVLLISTIVPSVSCRKIIQLNEPGTSALEVFNEAWEIIDQRYALFSIKETNWQNTYTSLSPKANAALSDQDLFNLLVQMLESLQDGHVSLVNSSKIYTYDHFYTAFPVNFNYANVVATYLGTAYHQTGPVTYSIRDSVGYLYYDSFTKSLSAEQLDEVFRFLQNTKGLIVDVRSNTGGDTRNAELFFRHFLADRQLVKYELRKAGKGHEDYAIPDPTYIEGSAKPYLQPVCVLINRSCYSACNDFVMYMSDQPNVLLVGDQTGGGGGFPSEYLLSNGWRLKYTATMTLSPDMKNFEKGISPDIPVGISNIDEQFGKDPILEKAFSILR